MLIISKLVLDPEWIRMIYGNYYDFFVIYIRSNQNSICAQVEQGFLNYWHPPHLPTHPQQHWEQPHHLHLCLTFPLPLG
jgi:hypothetical protein